MLKDRQHCPVLIIGGGIVGIGSFRELALQGIPAVLVERDDFCSGASSSVSVISCYPTRHMPPDRWLSISPFSLVGLVSGVPRFAFSVGRARPPVAVPCS